MLCHTDKNHTDKNSYLQKGVNEEESTPNVKSNKTEKIILLMTIKALKSNSNSMKIRKVVKLLKLFRKHEFHYTKFNSIVIDGPWLAINFQIFFNSRNDFNKKTYWQI